MSETTIFKKIIDGEVPCQKIYEDEHFLVFLDAFPETAGHTLIVPKKEYRWVWDVEPYHEYWDLARKITRALQSAFGTDFIISKVVGDEVPHAHIHLFPALPKDGTETDFEMIAIKIRNAL